MRGIQRAAQSHHGAGAARPSCSARGPLTASLPEAGDGEAPSRGGLSASRAQSSPSIARHQFCCVGAAVWGRIWASKLNYRKIPFSFCLRNRQM